MWSLRTVLPPINNFFWVYVECYSKFFMKWHWPLLLHTPGPLWKPPTWCGRHRTHWKLTATSTVAPTPPSTSPQDWFGLNLTSLRMGNHSGEASAGGRLSSDALILHGSSVSSILTPNFVLHWNWTHWTEQLWCKILLELISQHR